MMKPHYPKQFYKHPKMGFPTPISLWFKNELKDFIYDFLISKEVEDRGIFCTKYIKKLLAAHSASSGKTLYDYVRANKIYSLFLTEQWFRVFIDE